MIPEREFGFASITEIIGTPGLRELLIADIGEHGCTLLREIDPSTEEPILGIAGLLGSLALDLDAGVSFPTVMDIRQDMTARKFGDRPSYFTVDKFPLHTDLSFVTGPPRYILFHCVLPDEHGGGATLLSDCQQAISDLSSADQSVLFQPVFNFFHPADPAIGGDRNEAVYNAHDEIWRFRPDCMTIPEEAAPAVAAFGNALEKACTSLSLSAGDLFILDNHRLVHGRTEVQPYSDSSRERHLRRVYVQS